MLFCWSLINTPNSQNGACQLYLLLLSLSRNKEVWTAGSLWWCSWSTIIQILIDLSSVTWRKILSVRFSGTYSITNSMHQLIHDLGISTCDLCIQTLDFFWWGEELRTLCLWLELLNLVCKTYSERLNVVCNLVRRGTLCLWLILTTWWSVALNMVWLLNELIGLAAYLFYVPCTLLRQCFQN